MQGTLKHPQTSGHLGLAGPCTSPSGLGNRVTVTHGQRAKKASPFPLEL